MHKPDNDKIFNEIIMTITSMNAASAIGEIVGVVVQDESGDLAAVSDRISGKVKWLGYEDRAGLASTLEGFSQWAGWAKNQLKNIDPEINDNWRMRKLEGCLSEIRAQIKQGRVRAVAMKPALKISKTREQQPGIEANQTPDRMIRRKEVEAITGRSRSAIYEGMAAGTFPKPVKIGARAVAWPESVIRKWVEDKINGGH